MRKLEVQGDTVTYRGSELTVGIDFNEAMIGFISYEDQEICDVKHLSYESEDVVRQIRREVMSRVRSYMAQGIADIDIVRAIEKATDRGVVEEGELAGDWGE